jgi:hypothetical protein
MTQALDAVSSAGEPLLGATVRLQLHGSGLENAIAQLQVGFGCRIYSAHFRYFFRIYKAFLEFGNIRDRVQNYGQTFTTLKTYTVS